MTTTDAQRKAASLQAKAFYDAELRAKLEPTENGKYIVIDTESHDYEVDSSLIVATVHLKDRRPHGRTLALRIGHETTLRFPLRRPDSHDRAPAEQTPARKITKREFLSDYKRSPASLQAEAFYNAELRSNLEPAEKGKYIVIRGETHDYEVHSDPISAAVHLQDRQSGGEMFTFRIGYDSEQCIFHGLQVLI